MIFIRLFIYCTSSADHRPPAQKFELGAAVRKSLLRQRRRTRTSVRVYEYGRGVCVKKRETGEALLSDVCTTFPRLHAPESRKSSPYSLRVHVIYIYIYALCKTKYELFKQRVNINCLKRF